MKIIQTARFLEELEEILFFIAQDSITIAFNLQDEIESQLQNLSYLPYKCRCSTKSSDENIRDLVFHGYVIPYRINILKGQIEIIGIFSENKWEL